MRSLASLATFLFLAALVVGCSDHALPTAENAASLTPGMPSFDQGMGQGAIVVPNCAAAKGDIIGVAAPVSETDIWVTDVEVLTSHCVTQPSGKHTLTATSRILSDIPLPSSAVAVSLLDENGNPRVFNVFLDGVLIFVGSFECGFEAPPFDSTPDCVIRTTPGGITTVDARFDP